MKKNSRVIFKLLTLILLITVSLWLLPIGSVYADELTDDPGQEEPPPEGESEESDAVEETGGSDQEESDTDGEDIDPTEQDESQTEEDNEDTEEENTDIEDEQREDSVEETLELPELSLVLPDLTLNQGDLFSFEVKLLNPSEQPIESVVLELILDEKIIYITDSSNGTFSEDLMSLSWQLDTFAPGSEFIASIEAQVDDALCESTEAIFEVILNADEDYQTKITDALQIEFKPEEIQEQQEESTGEDTDVKDQSEEYILDNTQEDIAEEDETNTSDSQDDDSEKIVEDGEGSDLPDDESTLSGEEQTDEEDNDGEETEEIVEETLLEEEGLSQEEVAESVNPLTITIDDDPDPVAAGQNVTYTIEYANNGEETLTGVIVRSFIPANTTFISASGDGSHMGETVVWDIGELTPGQSGTCEVVVHIPQDSEKDDIYHNVVTIDSNETEVASDTETTIDPIPTGPQLYYVMGWAPEILKLLSGEDTSCGAYVANENAGINSVLSVSNSASGSPVTAYLHNYMDPDPFDPLDPGFDPANPGDDVIKHTILPGEVWTINDLIELESGKPYKGFDQSDSSTWKTAGGDILYITGGPVNVIRGLAPVSAGGGSGNVLAEFFNLYPTTMWDDEYVVPVGVDTGDSAPGDDMDFTDLVIQAAEDNTTVTIDDPVNGSKTIILNKGDNYIYRPDVATSESTRLDGGINASTTTIRVYSHDDFTESGYIEIEDETIYYAYKYTVAGDDYFGGCIRGIDSTAASHSHYTRVYQYGVTEGDYSLVHQNTTINADKPIQAGLMTSGGHSVDTRNYNLSAQELNGSDFFIPVDTGTGDRLYIYAFENNTEIKITDGLTTTIINLDSGEVDSSFMLPSGRAVHIQSYDSSNPAIKKPIQVLGAADSNSSDKDWGFQAIDSSYYSSDYVTPYAPGDDTGSSRDASWNPLYITPIADNTRVYVDWDGDGIPDRPNDSGSATNIFTDSNGYYYMLLDKYDIGKFWDGTEGDGDNGGAHIWARDHLDNTPPYREKIIVIYYGEASNADGSTGYDWGYSLIPLHPAFVFDLVLEKEADRTEAELGDTINYTFTVSNHGNAPIYDIVIDDPMFTSITWESGDPEPDGILNLLMDDSSAVAHASYLVTASDPIPGVLTNTAIAKGFKEIDHTGTYDVISNEDDWTVDLLAPATGSITLTKTGLEGSDKVTFKLYLCNADPPTFYDEVTLDNDETDDTYLNSVTWDDLAFLGPYMIEEIHDDGNVYTYSTEVTGLEEGESLDFFNDPGEEEPGPFEYDITVTNSPNSGIINGHKYLDKDGVISTTSDRELVEGLIIHVFETDSSYNNPVHIDAMSTDSNGFYEFDSLDPGYYIVAEDLFWENWFSLGPIQHQVYLEAGTTQSNIDFINSIKAQVTIVKDVKDPTGAQISDPTSFTVKVDGTDPQSFAEGSDYIYTLDPGEYTFTEDDKEGYTLDKITPDDNSTASDGTTIVLLSNDSKTITFENWQEYGKISGTKYEDEDGDKTTTGDQTTVSGWWVYLWRSLSGAYDDLTQVDSTQTDTDGNYFFDNVIPGFYRILEEVKTGWMELTDKFIDLVVGPGEEKTTGTDFVNFKKAKITVTKDILDPDGSVVSDDTGGFKVTLDGSDEKAIAEGVIAEYGDLAPGTYTIEESATPSNYTFDYYSIDEDSTTPGAQITVTSGAEISLIVYNRQQKATITVVKDVLDPTGAQAAFDDGSFTITTGAGEDAVLADGGSKTYTVNPGEYTFTEVDNPAYDLVDITGADSSSTDTGIATVEVASGGSATITYTNQQKPASVKIAKVVIDPDGNAPAYDNGIFTINTDAGASQDLTNGSDYTYTGLVPGTYTFTEADNSNYTLTNITGADSSSGRTATVTVSSDEDEEITFTNQQHKAKVTVEKNVLGPDGVTDVSDDHSFEMTLNSQSKQVSESSSKEWEVNPGTYSVVETTDPDYEFVSDTGPVTVGSGGTDTITVTNKQKPGDLTVTKVDEEDMTVLADTTFRLLDVYGDPAKDMYGNAIADVVTDANGEARFLDLCWGEYCIREIDPPEGYDITDDTMVTVGGEECDIHIHVMIADPRLKGIITIYKYAGASPLEGVEFDVTDGKGFATKVITGADGIATLSGLAWGTYYIKEVSAPDGYVMNPGQFVLTITRYDLSSRIDIENGLITTVTPPPPAITVEAVTEGGIEVLGIIEVLPFTGFNIYIPIAGAGIIIAGIAMLLISLKRKKLQRQ